MYDTNASENESKTAYLIAEMPDTERPRERMEAAGAKALSDTELLAILLRTGRPGRSVIDLARDVLTAFQGDLARIAGASLAELCKIPGIGKAKAIEIKAAFTLAQRLSIRDKMQAPILESPADVANLMREQFRPKKQEEFHALLLDTKHGLLRDECITIGLVDRSQIHAREVFRNAIQECCSRVILTHNHPSGDPTPSPQDIKCTKNLVAAGKIIGIQVLDHVIIGSKTDQRRRDYLSLREEKLM
ncbi:MAG: DNA repair protein RadC [Lentisphaeria bacterium]